LLPEDKNELRAGKIVFLKDMVNRAGEEFSSFVKIDQETGRLSFSRTQDGFDERPTYKIPQEVWGVTLKASERSDLQDGKAIFIEDMTGQQGQKFSSWIKLNENKSKLDYYHENPDQPRQTADNRNKKSDEITVITLQPINEEPRQTADNPDKKRVEITEIKPPPGKETEKQLEIEAKKQAKEDIKQEKAKKTSTRRKL
jgi:hypothetical protein